MNGEKPESDDWCGDFATASGHAARAGLLATPEQRLAWLESMLRLAAKSGALERVQRERSRERIF
ncbi:MAG: hypothetical protein JO197_04580 [Acidobacteria bacterium]|nr:hypothetical protein [Acidobacteriota bacterium]MBV9475270.1 hypothetical protein [Acidobacteriota bacterium]